MGKTIQFGFEVKYYNDFIFNVKPVLGSIKLLELFDSSEIFINADYRVKTAFILFFMFL